MEKRLNKIDITYMSELSRLVRCAKISLKFSQHSAGSIRRRLRYNLRSSAVADSASCLLIEEVWQ